MIDIRIATRGGESGVKKTLSEKTLKFEASYWENLKRSVKNTPLKACRK
jgi:hypothetical protein